MGGAIGARCTSCGRDHSCEGVLYTCERCGGTLDLLFDYAALKADPQVQALPLIDQLCPLETGIARSADNPPTPLLAAHALARDLGIDSLQLKDETRHLSGSLKDRATHMAIGRAVELGLGCVATASTGNAAASLSALAARVGLPAVVFAPRSTPPAKLRQIQVCGARLYLVNGNYDRAFELCQEACRERGWYSRNTSQNPYCGEGKKGVVIEIAEQLRFRMPDVIFVPVGDGCILGAVHKGLADLYHYGTITAMPRLVAVQAEGSAAIADAWREGREIRPVVADTLADSLAVDLPRDAVKALRALRESKGFAITVSDGEILEAVRDLARLGGLFAEPAGAATIAGLRKALAQGLVDPAAKVVALITGHGLKDRDAVAPLLEEPPIIESLKDLP